MRDCRMHGGGESLRRTTEEGSSRRSFRSSAGIAAKLLMLVALMATASALPLAGQAGGPRYRPSFKQGDYVGWEICQGCHLDQVNSWKATKMGQVMLGNPRNELEEKACESCHGPAKAHVPKGDVTKILGFKRASSSTVAERNMACLSCHEKTARTLWRGSTHESRNVACTDCHTVMHDESESVNLRKQTVVETCGRCHAQKKSQLVRSSHMPLGEGKMECTSCHNPHGSANEKMLIATSVNETCFSCHAEKRGPTLWEHAPVLESCANCHDPHGSNKEKMLKVPRPRLCQQCHPTGHGGPLAKPSEASQVSRVFNKACSNCHFNIHGSNHPAGAFFTR